MGAYKILIYSQRTVLQQAWDMYICIANIILTFLDESLLSRVYEGVFFGGGDYSRGEKGTKTNQSWEYFEILSKASAGGSLCLAGVWLVQARTLELPCWSRCCALTVGLELVLLPSPKFCGLPSSVWVSSAGMSVLFVCCNSPQTHSSNLEMIWNQITLWELYQWFILTLWSTRW